MCMFANQEVSHSSVKKYMYINIRTKNKMLLSKYCDKKNSEIKRTREKETPTGSSQGDLTLFHQLFTV